MKFFSLLYLSLLGSDVNNISLDLVINSCIIANHRFRLLLLLVSYLDDSLSHNRLLLLLDGSLLLDDLSRHLLILVLFNLS